MSTFLIILDRLHKEGRPADWREFFKHRWPADLWRKGYWSYLRSACWDHKRKACIHRANFRCELCSTSVAVQAHHVTYARLGDELPEDLQAVCVYCHKVEHGLIDQDNSDPKEE